jgi:hypothetical protein
MFRQLGGGVAHGGCAASRRQGPVESERMGGDRATVPIEDIQREKIRGCSYRRRCVSMSAIGYAVE